MTELKPQMMQMAQMKSAIALFASSATSTVQKEVL